MGFGEFSLFAAQAAFGADQDGDRFLGLFDFAEGAVDAVIQQQGAAVAVLHDRAADLHGDVQLGQAAAAGLFAGVDDDLLPVLHPAGLLLFVEFDHAALGEDGGDAGDAQFGGFLQGEVHALAAGDADQQVDGEFRLGFFEHQFAQVGGGALLAELSEGGGVLLAVVEEVDVVAGLQAQDVEKMVG